MEEKRFVAVRYFLIPVEESLFYTPLPPDEKRELFINALFRNQDYITNRGAHLRIRDISNNGSIYYGKLGKFKVYKIEEDTGEDFEQVPTEGWPNVRFVCNTLTQIMAIEVNHEFESNLGKICKWLESITNQTTLQNDYSTSFSPIVPEGDFWSIVDSATKLFSVSLVLNSPNLFGGNYRTTEGLTIWQRIFHTSSTAVTLSNDKGNLQLPREELEDYIKYADAGGGRWSIKFAGKNKRPRRISSNQRVISTEVGIDEETEIKALDQVIRNLGDIDETQDPKDK